MRVGVLGEENIRPSIPSVQCFSAEPQMEWETGVGSHELALCEFLRTPQALRTGEPE